MGMPVDGKSECTATSQLKGESIFVIITERRESGFRLTVITGDGVIVIDIP